MNKKKWQEFTRDDYERMNAGIPTTPISDQEGTWANHLKTVWNGTKKAANAIGGAVAYPFKKAAEYDYTPSDETMARIGLLNSVFGDNSILQMVNANKQAKAARDQQERYNLMLQEMNKADAAKEKALLNAKSHADALPINEKRLNEIYDKLAELDPDTDSVDVEDLENEKQKIYERFPELINETRDSRIAARREDKMNKKRKEAEAKRNEEERLYKVEQFLNTIPSTFKNNAAKDEWFAKINENPDMSTAEKTEALKSLRGVSTADTKTREAVQSAVAGVAAKRVSDKAADADEISKLLKQKTWTTAEMKKLKDNGWMYDINAKPPKWIKKKAD